MIAPLLACRVELTTQYRPYIPPKTATAAEQRPENGNQILSSLLSSDAPQARKYVTIFTSL